MAPGRSGHQFRHETETGWSLWHQSQKFREQFEANRQEMHQPLQGALIYDPELTETHHKLVALNTRI